VQGGVQRGFQRRNRDVLAIAGTVHNSDSLVTPSSERRSCTYLAPQLIEARTTRPMGTVS
jgi:hypothetical protein